MLVVGACVIGLAPILVRLSAAGPAATGFWRLLFALPLLAIPPAGSALLPWHLAEAVMISGFVLQISAKLTLRRSFGVVAANRGVKASGPYRLIRHPMYAGYALTHVGFLLAGPTLWNLAIYGTTITIQVRRIIAEERVLSLDTAYQLLMAKVRFRLLPFVF